MPAIVLASNFTNIPHGIKLPDDTNAFFNRRSYPILIEEVSFAWPSQVSQFPMNGSAVPTSLGDVLRAKITYQGVPITSGFVPINLLTRIKNWDVNVPSLGLPETSPINRTWTFPAPLYVPANGKVEIQHQQQNDFFTSAAAPILTPPDRVTLRGRRGLGPPSTIDIPYPASWHWQVWGSDVIVAGVHQVGLSAPITEESGPTDLVNPFNYPLAVERFIFEVSRTGYADDATGNLAHITALSPVDGLQPGGLVTGGAIASLAGGSSVGAPFEERFVSIKLSDFSGPPIVRDYLPLAAILSQNTRSWPCRSVLGTNEYYKVSLYDNPGLFAANPLGDAATIPFQARTGISIIGSRRVPKPEGR